MPWKPLVVFLVVAALALAATLALGDPLGLLGGGARSGGEDGGAAGLDAGGAGAASDPAAGSQERGPRLFGAEAFRRKGVGALRGRVLDVRTAKGVAGATLLLTGTGFGKEPVAARAQTAVDGTFAWNELPAGQGYALRVESLAQGARSLPGLEVLAGRVTDLGDLWLGKVGVISGRVLDVSGEPVAKAVVELHRGASSLREFFASGGFLEFFKNLEREPEPLARQESRSDGGFRFEAVSPGPHTLLVRAPGFRLTLQTVTLTGEGATEEVSVRLAPGATLTGKVVDEPGRPLAGVTVVAMGQDAGMATPLQRAFARSGEDGSFRFDSLGSDRRLLLIAASPGYPNTLEEVDAGEQGVRIMMRRGATLELRIVRDADGAPIEGAEVLCSVGEGEGLGDGSPATLIPGTTDRGGAVVLQAPPGQVQMLMVAHAERPPGFWMGGRRSGGMPGMLKAPADVKVPEGHTQLTFRAPDGVWITGRVLDGEGKPLAGVEVGTMSFLGGGQKAVSGSDGAFRLASDRSMGGSLRATLAGWVQEKVDYGDMKALRDPNVAEIKADIRMRAAVAVSGRVLAPDGTPLGGATVAVYRAQEKGEPLFDMSDYMGGTPSSLTLSDGTYVVDGVPAGRKVRVVARRPGFVDGGSALFETAGAGATAAPDVRMPAGLSLEVRVVATDERPVAGARVKREVKRSDGVEGDRFEDLIASQSGQDESRTDAAGKVRLDLLPPGEVTLRVSAAGYAPWGLVHTIAPDATSGGRVTVTLPPGVTLSGSVLDAQGQPVPEARVQVLNAPRAPQPGDGEGPQAADRWQEDWDRSRRVSTDREGRWRVADLPDRPLRVRVSKDGFKTHTLDVGSTREGLVLRLEAQTKDASQRLAEIDARLGELYQRLQEKSDNQQAVLEELAELQRERQRLAGDD